MNICPLKVSLTEITDPDKYPTYLKNKLSVFWALLVENISSEFLIWLSKLKME